MSSTSGDDESAPNGCRRSTASGDDPATFGTVGRQYKDCVLTWPSVATISAPENLRSSSGSRGSATVPAYTRVPSLVAFTCALQEGFS